MVVVVVVVVTWWCRAMGSRPSILLQAFRQGVPGLPVPSLSLQSAASCADSCVRPRRVLSALLLAGRALSPLVVLLLLPPGWGPGGCGATTAYPLLSSLPLSPLAAVAAAGRPYCDDGRTVTGARRGA